jgi:type II secretory pathway component PulM
MVGLAEVAQVAVAVLSIVSALGGAYHRWVVQPTRQKARKAMSKARANESAVEDNADDLDALDEDLTQTLDDLQDSIDTLADGIQKQRRESRGQSYQIYTLAKALNQDDDAPDVPVPDESDFLRGSGQTFARDGDD